MYYRVGDPHPSMFGVKINRSGHLSTCRYLLQHTSSPISSDPRYSRNGGRPFVLDGKLHRWALDSTLSGSSGRQLGGGRLHLFRIDELTDGSYWESYVSTITPRAPPQKEWGGNSNVQGEGGWELKWAAGRLGHVDLQPVPGISPSTGATSWFGLVDGDEMPSEAAVRERHFLRPGGGWRWAQTKRLLLRLVMKGRGGGFEL